MILRNVLYLREPQFPHPYCGLSSYLPYRFEEVSVCALHQEGDMRRLPGGRETNYTPFTVSSHKAASFSRGPCWRDSSHLLWNDHPVHVISCGSSPNDIWGHLRCQVNGLPTPQAGWFAGWSFLWSGQPLPLEAYNCCPGMSGLAP